MYVPQPCFKNQKSHFVLRGPTLSTNHTFLMVLFVMTTFCATHRHQASFPIFGLFIFHCLLEETLVIVFWPGDCHVATIGLVCRSSILTHRVEQSVVYVRAKTTMLWVGHMFQESDFVEHLPTRYMVFLVQIHERHWVNTASSFFRTFFFRCPPGLKHRFLFPKITRGRMRGIWRRALPTLWGDRYGGAIFSSSGNEMVGAERSRDLTILLLFCPFRVAHAFFISHAQTSDPTRFLSSFSISS